MIMISYTDIKAMAKERGCSVEDLIALARQNDPFYAGSKTGTAKAEWFAGIWKAWKAGRPSEDKAHLRRLHYWIVSGEEPWIMPNGKPYENTETCWDYLNAASKYARYLGLVGLDEIIDQKSPETLLFATYPPFLDAHISLPEVAEPTVYTWGFTSSYVQPYHQEVWVEKSTMDDVLRPICERYFANLQTGVGEMTLTRVKELTARVRQAKRPARIFYLSDFDPGGHSMPQAAARKLEWLVRNQCPDAEVKLKHMALTLEQVQLYRLPRTFIKKSEKRAKAFEDRFGAGAVELDALEANHPGELGAMIERELQRHYDHEAAAWVEQAERNLQQAIKARITPITERYWEAIAAIERMNEELQAAQPDEQELQAYAPPVSALSVEDTAEEWLYDSRRDYFEQLRVYKRYGGESAEGLLGEAEGR